MSQEPINPYAFKSDVLHDSTYRPNLRDVRMLQKAYEYMRDTRKIIIAQRDDLERRVDDLELEVWMLKNKEKQS